jgi:hypothetical protein
METQKKQRKPQRTRREFTDDFKAGAVRLVLQEGKSVTRVAKDLDLVQFDLLEPRQKWLFRVLATFSFPDVPVSGTRGRPLDGGDDANVRPPSGTLLLSRL